MGMMNERSREQKANGVQQHLPRDAKGSGEDVGPVSCSPEVGPAREGRSREV